MINITNVRKAYSEVYEFINTLGNEYKNKIPEELYIKLKEQRDKNYTPQYDINQENVNFSNEALSLISAINLQYWCDDSEEKERLKRVYTNNTQKEEQKYSYDNLFKKPPAKTDEIIEQECDQTQLIEYNQENIFTKLMNKLKSIFDKTINRKKP